MLIKLEHIFIFYSGHKTDTLLIFNENKINRLQSGKISRNIAKHLNFFNTQREAGDEWNNVQTRNTKEKTRINRMIDQYLLSIK